MHHYIVCVHLNATDNTAHAEIEQVIAKFGATWRSSAIATLYRVESEMETQGIARRLQLAMKAWPGSEYYISKIPTKTIKSGAVRLDRITNMRLESIHPQ